MKKPILLWASTLLLILFGFINQVQAQTQCPTKSDECFDFSYKGFVRNANGTVTLSFGVKVNCNRDLSHASFELPSGAKAIAATGPGRYENGTNNPFYSIKFEMGSGYKNGKTALFSYTVAGKDFDRMTSLRAEAKASTTVGMVSFSPKGCGDNGGSDDGDGDNGDGDNGDGNGGQPCNTSQPRPITGPTNPCPGEIVTYSIENDRNYTSFEWDVPRAQAGEPPVGWEIISGQGTNRVTVRVGQKNGTMKVKVNDPICGTKVATLPVKPGDAIEVSIKGDDKFCAGDVLVFEATGSTAKGKGNGNGKVDKKSFDFSWTVPTGWVIVSGQGTEKLIVKAGATAGNVSVILSSNAKKNKAICATGEASIPVTPKPNCNPCTKPDLSVDAPAEVCASGDKVYKFGVKNPDPSGKVKYQFFLPEDFQIVSQGYGFVNIKVNNAKPDSTLFVTVVAVNGNNCGAEAVCLPVKVEDCSTGGPCEVPQLAVIAPDTICNLADEPTTIRVAQPQAGVTYAFEVPEGFIVLNEGVDYVTVVAVFEEDQLGQPQVFTITATSECGTDTERVTVIVGDCGLGNPLPVTLTAFDGVSRNGAIELNWSTATEINNDRFEIERSADGKTFVKVGEVKGSGNSSVVVNYTYTDRHNASGTVYYRLKQVDTDNSSEYSKVIAVSHSASISSASSMSVYPNPVTSGNVTVRLQEAVKGTAIVRLVDLAGRQMYSEEVSGDRAELSVSLSSLNLKPGIYLISVTANGRNQTQRIVVQ